MPPARKGVVIGSIFGDALGAVVAPFVDVFTSAVDRIPGGDWARTAIANGASEIGDFAKTEKGFYVISALSGGLAVGVAPIVGPAVVNLAIATPGLVAGDDFTTAYTKGAADYLTKAVRVFGPLLGDSFSKEVSAEAQKLMSDAGFQDAVRAASDAVSRAAATTGIRPADVLSGMGLSPDELAARFDTHPDVAAIASNAVLHKPVYDMASFDPTTRSQGAPRTAAEIRRELQNAEARLALPTLPSGAALPFLRPTQQTLSRLRQDLADAEAREAKTPPAADAPPLPPPEPPPPPPPAVGYVRIVRDPTPLRARAAELGRLALLTSPLWGYVWLRHRGTLP